MADNSNKKDGFGGIDPQDSLVKSLESIKALLEEGDNKITQARKSIARATSISNESVKHADDKPATEQHVLAEGHEEQDAVPLLDEIVIHEEDGLLESLDNIIVEHDDIPIEQIETDNHELFMEQSPMEQPQLSPQLDEEQFAALQSNVEKRVHNKLIQIIVQLEAEIKKIVREEIDDIFKK